MTPHMEPIENASAWTADDLERDQSWKFSFSDQHRAELDKALQQVNEGGLPFAEIQKEDFPLPSLSSILQGVLDELRDGRGFAFISGMPTEYDYNDLEKLYWGLCAHLGTGVTQNSEAGLIHYITDGQLRPQHGARILCEPVQLAEDFK